MSVAVAESQVYEDVDFLRKRKVAHIFPGRCLSRRPWATVDLSPQVSSLAVTGGAAGVGQLSVGGGGSSSSTRAAAGALLRRGFSAAGASTDESKVWAEEVERAAWAAAAASAAVPSKAAPSETDALALPGDAVELSSAATRQYRAEVRRLCTALKEPSSAQSLLSRLQSGDLQPMAILALPAEDLLPEAKRARLQELRAGTPEAPEAWDMEDPSMACAECGEVGGVRYNRLAEAKEGFAKAEIWGSKDTENKGDRCQAQCTRCLADWVFER